MMKSNIHLNDVIYKFYGPITRISVQADILACLVDLKCQFRLAGKSLQNYPTIMSQKFQPVLEKSHLIAICDWVYSMSL